MKLSNIKGVGEKTIDDFASLGITTLEQLLDNYPRRYEDYSTVTTIDQLVIGKVSIQARIKNVTARYVRRGMHITEAVASDGTGSVKLVWFNQPYRQNAVKADQEYFISGNYDLRRSQFTITSPSIELVSDLPVNAAKILPVYKETKTLKSTKIRKIYAQVFRHITDDMVDDWLPEDIREAAGVLTRATAIRWVHMPSDRSEYEQARQRFTFDELFVAMFASALNKKALKLIDAPVLSYDDTHTAALQHLRDTLAFELTDDQRKVTWQVLQDMGSNTPMNRIIEGDVGSGKTMVALFASYFALQHGMQVAIMSPTEILARQHYETFTTYLEKLGIGAHVHLLVGSLKATEKKAVHALCESGAPCIVIGTQALISKNVRFANLALVVVDEQHRFGVDQRKMLQKEAQYTPHFMSMTATPIPRSLALTIFGELDISILNEKPKGRKIIQSKLVSWDERQKIIALLEGQIAEGRQAFIVCPSIDKNTSSAMRSVSEIGELYTEELKGATVAVLHGRMASDKRESIMQAFAERKIDVLVSTTVIEVGIDFPNASVMVIESAERFGLAQIHQLRGRVGRGEYQGYCYLIPTNKDANTYRLEQVAHTHDGFKLAEFDLSQRGPGAVYGSLQHGAFDFRLVDITDVKTIQKVNELVKKHIDTLDLGAYPALAKKIQEFQVFSTLN